MSRLLQANLRRLKKSRVFWICIAAMAAWNIAVCSAQYSSMMRYPQYSGILDQFFFNYMAILGIVMAVFCSLFVGTEYSDGTIRNKIIQGRPRKMIYMANFLTCVLAGSLFILVGMGTMCLFGFPMFGFLDTPLWITVGTVLLAVCVCAAYAGIYTLLSMLISSKASGAVAALVFSFVMLFGASYVLSCLRAPKQIEQWTGGIDGDEFETVVVDNPHYLTGKKRELFQLLRDLTPAGQSSQIVEQSIMEDLSEENGGSEEGASAEENGGSKEGAFVEEDGGSEEGAFVEENTGSKEGTFVEENTGSEAETSGQAQQIEGETIKSRQDISVRFLTLAAYSMMLVLLFNGVGIYFFGRKDIK